MIINHLFVIYDNISKTCFSPLKQGQVFQLKEVSHHIPPPQVFLIDYSRHTLHAVRTLCVFRCEFAMEGDGPGVEFVGESNAVALP